MSLWVNEIFYSIQGESSQVGRPCVFVRLTGCNLRCSFCDTTYAYDEGVQMTMGELENRVQTYPCRLVEITGGEPLLQRDVPSLVTHLLDGGWEVMLETNGSLDIDMVDNRCRRIVDVKLPRSGEHDRMRWENVNRLTERDEIKFVIADEEDYACARSIVNNHPTLKGRLLPPLFSPATPHLDPRLLADWILHDNLEVRLQIPIHKVLWGKRRGV